MITGQEVTAHLVQRVRSRNGLEKAWPWRAKRKIKSSYDHVISVDVVRENGKHIFGFIQDDTKLVFHYHAKAQTAAEAVNGLKLYIGKHGRPEAVRSDNGSEFKGEFIKFLEEAKESEKPIAHLRPKPYNPRANGFIERYFRTLRQSLFRKAECLGQEIDQNTLNDFAILWNHFRVVGKTNKTPAELAGTDLTQEDLNRFRFTKETVSGWTFWHIEGVNGLLHAYLREEKLPNMELIERQKIA